MTEKHVQSPEQAMAVNRRNFLQGMGQGLGSVALSSMLFRDGAVQAADPHWSAPDGKPHFPPKAKNVIWLFMLGGVSQIESFDPKPALNTYAGKSIAETPFQEAIEAFKRNVRVVVPDNNNSQLRHKCYPMQVGFRKHGESGIEVTDWWPHTAGCIDDIALVRSMWTTDPNHTAMLQFHTGRTKLDGTFPSLGSWVNYGLGAINENLPQFVVMGKPPASCCGGTQTHGADYLGPAYGGVQLAVDEKNPLPFGSPGSDVFQEEQRAEFETLRKLNGVVARDFPEDEKVLARIKSYELAYRMQSAVPGVMRLTEETASTQSLYGLDQDVTRPFGEQLLAARRLVERGVRFIQIYHGFQQQWDAHSGLKKGYTKLCKQVDQPIAGLLKDLKLRGLLEDTIVVFASEFGRTPGAQNSDGRDHHPFGFTVWMSGGGIKGGIAHGATDELGYNAVVDRHYVTDIHATLMHQLGLNPQKLDVPGRQRIDLDYGHPIREIIA